MVPVVTDNVWPDRPFQSGAFREHISAARGAEKAFGAEEASGVEKAPGAEKAPRARPARNGSLVAFWLKDGVNMRPGDPCYGLFQEVLEFARHRPVVAFCFADATINRDAGADLTYAGRFERVTRREHLPRGCNGRDQEILHLPQIVMRVGRRVEALRDCLVEAVGEGVRRLEQREAVRPLVGFTGLADALLLLMRTHHGWSQEAQAVGLVIVDLLRQALEDLSATGRRYRLLSVVEPCRFPWSRPGCRYGFEAWGVRDPYVKIAAEAPFHRYCDGGHVTIVRWDRRRPIRYLEDLLVYAREQDVGCVWPC